jgi:hypothetical protein
MTMCKECPAEVKDLAMRIGAYVNKCGHIIAGGLHIVIEDENVETEHILWCMNARKLDAESQAFAEELLKMPAPYRHVVVQFAWDDVERQSWTEED